MKRMLFNATQAEELRVAIVDGQKLLDLDPLREYDVRIERPGFETFAEHVQFGDKRVVQIEPRLKKATQTP